MIPTTMRAIVKPSPGPGLELAEMPTPHFGPQDVLIRVRATSICGSDVPLYDWDDPWISQTVKPGQIPGHEFCGTIIAMGKQVSGLSLGDFVTAEGHINCGVCWHCRNGEAHICPNLKLVGFERPGSFAEYIAVPATNVIRLSGLPTSIAAFLDAFGNAVHAAFTVSMVNQTVLVTGCGPIGLMVICLARLSGARRIFATEPRRYRQDLAAKLRADLVLDPTQGDIVDTVRRETEAESGVDVFLEMSGNAEALTQGFSALRPGGKAVLLGLPKAPVVLDVANHIIVKNASVYGIVGRRMYHTWNQALRLLDPGQGPCKLDLAPLVTHRLLLEQYKEGFDLMRSGQCGKVVLYPDADSLAQSYSELAQ